MALRELRPSDTQERSPTDRRWGRSSNGSFDVSPQLVRDELGGIGLMVGITCESMSSVTIARVTEDPLDDLGRDACPKGSRCPSLPKGRGGVSVASRRPFAILSHRVRGPSGTDEPAAEGHERMPTTSWRRSLIRSATSRWSGESRLGEWGPRGLVMGQAAWRRSLSDGLGRLHSAEGGS